MLTLNMGRGRTVVLPQQTADPAGAPWGRGLGTVAVGDLMLLPVATTQGPVPELLPVPSMEEFHLVWFKLICSSFSSVHKVLLCIFCLFAETQDLSIHKWSSSLGEFS